MILQLFESTPRHPLAFLSVPKFRATKLCITATDYGGKDCEESEGDHTQNAWHEACHSAGGMMRGTAWLLVAGERALNKACTSQARYK